MQNFVWGLKHIFIPLMPFLGGAIIRNFALDQGGLSIFHPADLAFSMFLLSVLVAASGRRLASPPEVGEAIYHLSLAPILGFAIIFALATFLVSDSQQDLANYLTRADTDLKALLNSPQVPQVIMDSISDISKTVTEAKKGQSDDGLNGMRYLTFIFSGVVIVAALTARVRYKLPD